MSETQILTLDRISQLRFRPTKEADEFLESYLRKTIIAGERYRSARLALARSMNEQDPPPIVPKGTEFGSAIEGGTLFGSEEKSVWSCLIADTWPEPVDSADLFKAVVEAHWHRGAQLLRRDMTDARENDVEFAIGLATLAGLSGGATDVARPGAATHRGAARVAIRVGEVSIELKSNAPVEVVLNAPGTSPHLALMGKTRTGKTRTGLEMAQQLTTAARTPVLFIDPRGEFVKDGAFVPKTDWGGRTFADRFPNTKAIDVGRTPVPLDFLALVANPAQYSITQAAITFKDTFQKCIRAKGDVALDNLREVVSSLMHARVGLLSSGIVQKPISLRDVRDAVRERNQDEERGKDSIEAKLNELVELNLFDPSLSPAAFFSRSWVIGLGATTDEAKKLVMFLVLDALAAHMIGQQDAPTDSTGHRVLRHLLVVDEARDILAYKHGALSQLLRKAGSKGEVVMLLSQSPEDFDKEEDDFLSQMGTVGVFASSTQSVKCLRPVMGKKIQPEDLTDSAIGKGVALVKLPGRDPTKILTWR